MGGVPDVVRASGTRVLDLSERSPKHMTKEQAGRVKVGDVILVGVRKDQPAIVNAIYRRGVAPPYFGTTAESGFTSWRLAALPSEPIAENAA